MDGVRELAGVLCPAFAENNIAIAFASNDAFVPYMATMIYSIIVNGNADNNYDFVVLQSDIASNNQQKLYGMTDPYKNVSLRIIDVTAYIEGYLKMIR